MKTPAVVNVVYKRDSFRSTKIEAGKSSRVLQSNVGTVGETP